MTTQTFRRLLTGSLASLALPVLAHHTNSPVDEIDEFLLKSFGDGVLHPLSGLDHILTSVGLGLLCLNGRCESKGMVPLLFSFFMVLGATLAGAGQSLPLMETLLALSVAALGLAASFPRAGGWRFTAVLIAGLWTGNAHGSQMPYGWNAFAYGTGFLLTQAALAVLAARLLNSGMLNRSEPGRRWAAGLLTAFGLMLWLGR